MSSTANVFGSIAVLNATSTALTGSLTSPPGCLADNRQRRRVGGLVVDHDIIQPHHGLRRDVPDLDPHVAGQFVNRDIRVLPRAGDRRTVSDDIPVEVPRGVMPHADFATQRGPRGRALLGPQLHAQQPDRLGNGVQQGQPCSRRGSLCHTLMGMSLNEYMPA